MGETWEKGMAAEEEVAGVVAVKCAPNEELNSTVAREGGVPGEVGDSVVAVAGSVDEPVEALEPGVVAEKGDPEPALSGHVADATEKVESWDLSEAIAKSAQDCGEKEGLKPKTSDDGSPEGAPGASIGSMEESSVGGELGPDFEESAKDSEYAGCVTEAPSDTVGSGKTEGEAVQEGVHEVVEAARSAEPDEASASLEGVLPPGDDVGGKPVEVNSEDVDEVASVVPSASVGRESPETPAEGPSDNVESGALDAPGETGKLDAQAAHEVGEPTTSPEAGEGSAEPGSMSGPVDVEEKPVEVNSSEAVTSIPSENAETEGGNPAEGPSDTVDSEGVVPEVHDEVEEPTTSAAAVERSAESESGSGDEKKSVEVNSEDTRVMPSESVKNDDVNPEIPAAQPSDSFDSKALEPEVVLADVESASNAEAAEGSAQPMSVSAPADGVKEKSVEVNPEDTSEPNTVISSEKSGDNQVASREFEPDEWSVGKVGGEVTLFAPVEEVHEVIEATNSPEEPESMSIPPDDEEESVEADSGDMKEATTASESANNEAAGSELLTEEAHEIEPVHEVVEPTNSEEEPALEPEHESAPDYVEDKSIGVNSDQIEETEAKPDGGSSEPASISTSDEVEDKAVVASEAITELESVGKEVSSIPPAEVPADAQAHPEVAEPTTYEDPVEEAAEPQPVSAPSEDKSSDVNSDSTGSGSDDNEVVSLEPSADNVGSEVALYAPAEEVHEVWEATISAEPNEESAEPESMPVSSDDGDDGFVMVNSTDVAEAVTESELVCPAEGSAGNVDGEVVEVEEVDKATEPTTSAEASVEPETLSAAGDVEDKPVEAHSEDATMAVPELPSESAEDEIASRELPADKADAPVEEIGEVANRDEVSVGLEPVAAPSESTPTEAEPEVGVTEMEKRSPVATSILSLAEEEKPDLDHEHGQSEVSASIGVDTTTDANETDTAQPSSEDIPEGRSSEEASGLLLESRNESLSAEDGAALVDRCIQVEELPQDDAPESQEGASRDAGHEGVAEGGDISKEENQSASDSSVKDVSHLIRTEMTDEEAAQAATHPVTDVSHLLRTVMTDEEVKAAAAPLPENTVASEASVEDDTPAVESRVESLVPSAESSGASHASEVETVSRDFNFSEVPTTSEESHDAEPVTPYLATALAVASDQDNSSDAAAPRSETSTPPPAVEKEVAPRSYNLDEVATHLHDAAQKALDDAKASNVGEGQTSVAQSVAQIVLDESSKTEDPSEYISGVVQDVAQLAQDAASSDPNILPDTVARVFDGETAASPADEGTQGKETTSLGTMVSLLIVWCVSLCASRISSKDMPAPALKLAAEEVTAVLHSNAPPQSHDAASSNH